MRSAPHLFNEDARLAALAQYDLLGGTTPVDLEDVVQIASHLFAVPIVLVSIVERARQVFRAKVGLDVCETARDVSFCAHALALPADDMLVVPDALLDVRFASNPLVTGEPHVRFYAGVPLRSPDGFALGTLCIIDRQPRHVFSARERSDLQALAALVCDRLEMRRLAVAGEIGQSRFENIAATSPDGIICADHRGLITFWNEGAEALFGFTAGEAIGASIDLIVPARMRGGHGGGLARVAAGGVPRLVGTTVQLPATHKDGTEFPIELSLSMWRTNDVSSFGAIIRDISERQATEDRLFRLAHFDGLTGLPNRSVMMNRIRERTREHAPVAVLMIDIDCFKDVNDTLGHTAGDFVLKELARRIADGTRGVDTVARVGGDEFVILMPDAPSRDTIGREVDALIEALTQPITVDAQVVHVGASVGVALYPDDGATAEDLLSAADLAMYQAKAEGRSCRRFFTPQLRAVAISRRTFQGEMRRAMEQGEFELFYQPQVRIADGAILGAEALIRWRHPEQGLLAPGQFLPAMEAGLLAPEIGRWVLDTACRDASLLRQEQPGLVMGVNLFGAQFRSGLLAREVEQSLARWSLPPQALELEVTENIILRYDETMLTPLCAMRASGIGIAFDDFGTGFASLSMLKRYPLTRIKIDRSFVRDVVEDRADAAIVCALVNVAHSLGIEVIAEGVETAAQREALAACGCREAQGYLFGRPMPRDDLLRLLAKDHAVAA